MNAKPQQINNFPYLIFDFSLEHATFLKQIQSFVITRFGTCCDFKTFIYLNQRDTFKHLHDLVTQHCFVYGRILMIKQKILKYFQLIFQNIITYYSLFSVCTVVFQYLNFFHLMVTPLFKLRFFYPTDFIIRNIEGLRHWVAKI